MLFYHEGNAIYTLWCLIEGLEYSGSWINLQRLISGGGGSKMIENVIEKGMVSCHTFVSK